ncbi:MAG: VWA domain-containing protein, partial [Bryobacteraceae bacterium]
MRFRALLLTVLLAAQGPGGTLLAQRPTFSSTTSVVIVNVTVLDRNGKPIENLTKNDFELYEDGKPQRLQAVDFQHLNNSPLPSLDDVAAAPAQPKGYNPEAEKTASKTSLMSKYQDRRLMVMLFDFSS